MATIARVNVLLLAALGGDGAGGAWSMLHRTIVEIVRDNNVAGNTCRAYDYLQSFITENGAVIFPEIVWPFFLTQLSFALWLAIKGVNIVKRPVERSLML